MKTCIRWEKTARLDLREFCDTFVNNIYFITFLVRSLTHHVPFLEAG